MGETQDLLIFTKENGNAFSYCTLLRSFLPCKGVEQTNLSFSDHIEMIIFLIIKVTVLQQTDKCGKVGRKFGNHFRENPCKQFSAFISSVFSMLVR